MRWFFRSDYRSFYLLNATQFLGALNDNVFKLLVIYLLINAKGVDGAATVLSLAGAIFVIPFLLFSSGAGVLADRVSKRTIIVVTRLLEVVITIFGVISVAFVWEAGAYSALFLMATQSSVFGPSKYGIIPELVEEKMVPKANGSITSFTYLAIILGTFLASFITDVTNKNFVVLALFCVFIAIAGFLASLGINRTEPQRSPKKINPFFLYEIYQTMKLSRAIPSMSTAIFGSAFFLFIGAFTQLNIIPFAMQSLHLSEVGGGYLFLATAIGIAIGAVIAGQLSKNKVEPGMSCISGFFIALFFCTLFLFSSSMTCTLISLGLLGAFGGGFLIPFDSFIQINSPDEKRGRIIAAANFFSFVGVLLAAFFLYLISEKLQFSAASGFGVMSFFSLVASIVITGKLSHFFLPFFAQKILKRFRRLKLSSALPKHSEVIILQQSSWWDALLLYSCIPHLKLLVLGSYLRHFPWINGWIHSIRLIPKQEHPELDIEKCFSEARKLQERHYPVCIFFHREKYTPEMNASYKKVLHRFRDHIVFAKITKEKVPKRFIIRFNQKHIKMEFTAFEEE